MKTFALLLCAVLSQVGCSSDDDHTAHDTDTGTSGSDTSATDDASGTDTATPGSDVAADDTAADAARPNTPEVVSVMPMAGAWHVTWKLNDTGLTKVELWRSNDGAAATLVKALGGTARDYHDGAATGSVVKYCYTVKTFRGTLASDSSAEKCNK